MSRPTDIRNGYVVYLHRGELTWVESPLRTKVRSVPESCLNCATVRKMEALSAISVDLYLVVRDDRVDAAIGTCSLAAGTAMAYSNGYRISVVLVSPVTTNTAALDHFEGSLIGRSGDGNVSLLANKARGSLTQGR
jgi:hypothetical protein